MEKETICLINVGFFVLFGSDHVKLQLLYSFNLSQAFNARVKCFHVFSDEFSRYVDGVLTLRCK